MRFIDSPQQYLPSLMSTTSGLGSNLTTSGPSSSLLSQTTQSPRKNSTASFTEFEELPEEMESRAGLYIPGDYENYPQQNMIQSGVNAGYFGLYMAN
jgi:hypothetical protein